MKKSIKNKKKRVKPSEAYEKQMKEITLQISKTKREQKKFEYFKELMEDNFGCIY